MKVIVPKTLVPIGNHGPIFFLAGPVRGGGDWQRECCEEIRRHVPNFYVAIPYYHHAEETYPLMAQAEPGQQGVFERQLNWEWHYLDLAARDGCVIFWLPEESKVKPRSSGAYATDTRGEIARWSVERKYNPHYRVVVGAEPGFPSLSQIQRNWNRDQGREEPFPTTLAETVRAAVVAALDP
jgi:hypothetical protein